LTHFYEIIWQRHICIRR